MKDLLGDEPVRPVTPPAAWLGGKRQLAKHISKRLAALSHDTYVETFVGMGGLFFRRPFKSKCEVINDFSGDVVNLFRILQRHYPQMMDCLKFQVTSRADFERLLATPPASLTDLERAARFLYLQRTAFGGKTTGQSFGVSTGTAARFDVNRLGPLLDDVHERLSGVVIENLSWSKVIEVYDRPTTLFYLDPPYWDCENDYGKGMFSKSDFHAMAEQMAAIKGRFILSLNDVPSIRKIFDVFDIEAVEATYSIGQKASTARELIISN